MEKLEECIRMCDRRMNLSVNLWTNTRLVRQAIMYGDIGGEERAREEVGCYEDVEDGSVESQSWRE